MTLQRPSRTPADDIRAGRTSLGIELGSTRIKACLIGGDATEVLATGSFSWENRLEAGLWTSALDDVWTGIRSAYAAPVSYTHLDVYKRQGCQRTSSVASCSSSVFTSEYTDSGRAG